MKIIQKYSFLKFYLIILFLLQCAKVDPITGEKILIEPDPVKKARQAADAEGGLFGDLRKNNKTNNFEFSSSNVLWRATLQSLEFLPLLNADYSGGIVIYDWYSDNLNSKELIKVTVRFLSNELRANSLRIIVHKKTCDENNVCSIKKVDGGIADEIKDKILLIARTTRLEEEKEKKSKN
jgi:hypothetical protein